MANYSGTPASVTAYRFGGTASKKKLMKTMTLTFSTMGGATNNIPASVLGFTKIEASSSAVLSDNSAIYPTSPSYDGTLLLIGGGTSGAPQDLGSVTIRVTCWGY